MVNELLGIQYNIAKKNITDRKVQNLASYINVDTLRVIHKTVDKRKASGIDGTCMRIRCTRCRTRSSAFKGFHRFETKSA